ncbi:hypothetical protein PAPHI01_1651 [Pancytospora philotis]|nr:hypothetical protein PAPHI01_1651 [Pancytospora philotis]
MKNFKSLLFVRTKSRAEKKLAETVAIHTLPHPFTVGPRADYVYVYDGALAVYTTVPFNRSSQTEYKQPVTDLLATKGTLYTLTDDGIFAHAQDSFKMHRGEFKGGRLVALSFAGAAAGGIGVQKRNELEVYDRDFRLAAVYSCQTSFCVENTLITGDFNTLSIMRGGQKLYAVTMPDNITAITCDTLMTKIFCACSDNAVYAISTDGGQPQKMDYHKQPVAHMRLSFCGRYLFSADTSMVCVWDTAAHNVVVDFAVYDAPIEGIALALEGNRVYNRPHIKIA